jgi:hypothetical protein
MQTQSCLPSPPRREPKYVAGFNNKMVVYEFHVPPRYWELAAGSLGYDKVQPTSGLGSFEVSETQVKLKFCSAKTNAKRKRSLVFAAPNHPMKGC